MRYRWIPAVILALGAALTLGAARQRALPLERSMGEVIPAQIDGYIAQDLLISDDEAEVAGFSNYLFRVYESAALDTTGTLDSADSLDSATSEELGGETESSPPPWFSLYVGYYESQTRGNTIHSPKNCLPGAGWEALSSVALDVELEGRTVRVNRFLLQNGNERSLALYWYQGRGRIAHDEYRVKLNLLRDAAFRRRSDEALVRIIVPVGTDEEIALLLAQRAAKVVIPSLDQALPG